MTLKEKFLNSPCEKGYINTNVYRAENNVKIADEFAIEFGEYLDSLTAEDMGTTPIKEFLEFFKKEKGL